MEQIEKEIVIYTDGACSCNGKENAKAGIGIYIPSLDISISQNLENMKKVYSSLDLQYPTNNKAELLAILQAISWAISQNKLNNKDKSIMIKSDSNYSIKSINEWSKKWEKNNWKTSTGKPVLNKDIIQEILKYTKKYPKNIKIEHTPAHKQKPSEKSKMYPDWYGNMKADSLAVMSIQK